MRLALTLTTALAMAGCTSAQMQTASTDGQLFCAVGPTVVAMSDPSGAAVLAKGNTAAYVRAACAAMSALAVPVVPPPTAVPTVAIIPPSQGT